MMRVRITEEHDDDGDDDDLCIERDGWALSSGILKQLGVGVAHSASPQKSTSVPSLHAHRRPVPTRRLIFPRTSAESLRRRVLFLELPIHQQVSLARIRGLKRAFSAGCTTRLGAAKSAPRWIRAAPCRAGGRLCFVPEGVDRR